MARLTNYYPEPVMVLVNNRVYRLPTNGTVGGDNDLPGDVDGFWDPHGTFWGIDDFWNPSATIMLSGTVYTGTGGASTGATPGDRGYLETTNGQLSQTTTGVPVEWNTLNLTGSTYLPSTSEGRLF